MGAYTGKSDGPVGATMRFIHKRTLFALGIVILGLTAFLFYRAFYKERVIVTVGDYTITEKDKNLRDQVQRVFYPQDPNSYGKDQLVTAFTYAQILKNNGHEITEALLRAEEMRINQNTKAPEVLQKIRDLFKGDEEAYKKVFILPTYAERTIFYDFFNKSPKAHEQSLKNVQQVFQQLQTAQSSFPDVAQRLRLTYKTFTLSKEKGMEWEQDKQVGKDQPAALVDLTTQAPAEIQQHIAEHAESRSLESARYWIDNIIGHMKAGEVAQAPVDFEQAWLVVQYVKLIGKDKFLMGAIFIPKDNYENWLENERSKIGVQQY
jgi:hypothetical protein